MRKALVPWEGRLQLKLLTTPRKESCSLITRYFLRGCSKGEYPSGPWSIDPRAFLQVGREYGKGGASTGQFTLSGEEIKERRTWQYKLQPPSGVARRIMLLSVAFCTFRRGGSTLFLQSSHPFWRSSNARDNSVESPSSLEMGILTCL